MTNMEARLRRIEMVLLMLAERDGTVKQGSGPMDPAWRARRQRQREALQEIINEQAEPILETR